MSKDINWPDDRAELYALLLKQVDALIDRRRHAISTLANAAALIYDALCAVRRRDRARPYWSKMCTSLPDT